MLGIGLYSVEVSSKTPTDFTWEWNYVNTEWFWKAQLKYHFD